MIPALNFALVLLGSGLFILVPAYLLMSLWPRLKPDLESFSVGILFVLLILALAAPLCLLAHQLNPWLPLATFLIVMVGLWWQYWRRRRAMRPGFSGRWPRLNPDEAALCLLFGFNLMVVGATIAAIPYPYPSFDWFDYSFARIWNLTHGIYAPPRERPPLFSLLILVIQSIYNSDMMAFWITQAISTILNSLLIFPAYLLVRQLFSRQIAFWGILLMIISPFHIYETVLTWPKNLAAFFILLMLYALFFRPVKTPFFAGIAGISAALAYLAHPYGLHYDLTAGLIMLALALAGREKLRRIGIFVITFALVLLPYFLWVYLAHNTLKTSTMVGLWPFCVHGYAMAYQQTPAEIMRAFAATPWFSFSNWQYSIIGIRLSNLLRTMTFYQPEFAQVHFHNRLPAALTSPVYWLALAGVIAYLRHCYRTRRFEIGAILATLLVWPLFMMLVQFGWWNQGGMMGEGLHPLVPLLTTLAVWVVFRLSRAFAGWWRIWPERLALLVVFILVALVLGYYDEEIVPAVWRLHQVYEPQLDWTQNATMAPYLDPQTPLPQGRLVSLYWYLNNQAGSALLVPLWLGLLVTIGLLAGYRPGWKDHRPPPG
jgi:hypothetical protein